jgi:hypothetical protein
VRGALLGGPPLLLSHGVLPYPGMYEHITAARRKVPGVTGLSIAERDMV